MPKLSIITINLNNRDGLEKTIKSVVSQSYQDFEYLVIDGASSDGSVEIIKKYENRIAYWISEKDSGIYNAMNKGIQKANGKYLLFLNSGDFFLDKNSLLKPDFTSDKNIITCGIIVELKKILSQKYYFVNKPIKKTFFARIGFIPHQSTFIKKEMFQKLGLYNESYTISGDYEFFMRLYFNGEMKYAVCKEAISVYDDMGISANPKERKRQNQEYKKMIKTNAPFFCRYYMLSILWLRNTIRPFLRKSARFFGILNLYHRFSLKKSQ